jgi:hypothetical protein
MFYYFDYDEPLFRPPSEANSLIFQITLGCSQNHCTFCGMYKSKNFRIRPVSEILDEIEAVPLHHRPHIQRIFLADGDALVYPQPGLEVILDALATHFPGLTRVGAYASPKSLTTKTVELCGEIDFRSQGTIDESAPSRLCATATPGFSSVNIKSTSVDIDKLNALFDEFHDVLLRGKGIVDGRRLELVNGAYSWTDDIPSNLDEGLFFALKGDAAKAFEARLHAITRA